MTELIEVNINNLAAVPSIVFGLLGLAIFLNFFGMPRSSPLVGGLVLALLVLPTIIIASRAALRAVPPSIREAALGIGASHQQAVFHHVLPLAMPGIMTGTIIGMAHALGETAPLLLIGMVAFIVDIPHGITDAATVLPVQIFLWSDLPELAFRAKTSAAIIVLLLFLFVMNGAAILLRDASSVAGREDPSMDAAVIPKLGNAVLTPPDPDILQQRPVKIRSRHVNVHYGEKQAIHRSQHRHPGPRSFGLHRALGMRQVDLFALHQPDERYDPDRAGRREDRDRGAGHLRQVARCGAAPGPGRHGVPEAQSVSQIDLRECRLWAAHSRSRLLESRA